MTYHPKQDSRAIPLVRQGCNHLNASPSMTENRDLAVNGHDPPVLCAKCHKDIGLGRPTSSPSHVSINSAASYPLQTTSTSPITHTNIRPQPTPDTSGPSTWRDRHLSLKLKIGRILESKRTHQILLILVRNSGAELTPDRNRRSIRPD